jgi:ABC-2 type transport system ATP-binding protein
MIETVGLRKSFKSKSRGQTMTVEAVRGVGISVEAGEIFGFLGPNGAGKTTVLRMLTTLIRPDEGEIRIADTDARRDPVGVRRRIGYVAQGGSTYDDATPREELVMHARLYGIGKADAEQRAERALAAFELDAYADRRCKTFSGGIRRRVELALGIIHAPQVLFLDEPTAALDPPSRARLWDEVRRLRDEGMTVFLSTHYLEEADMLCDRVAIIDQGQIVAEGTPGDLKRGIAGDVVTVHLNGPAPAVTDLLRTQDYVKRIEPVGEGALCVYVEDAGAATPWILRALDEARVPLGSIEVRRPSLDDVFLTKTGRVLQAAAEGSGTP